MCSLNNSATRLVLSFFLLICTIMNMGSYVSSETIAFGTLDEFGHNEKASNDSTNPFIFYLYNNKYGNVFRFDLTIPYVDENDEKDYFLHASIFDSTNQLLTTIEQKVKSYEVGSYSAFPTSSIVCPPKLPPDSGGVAGELFSNFSVSIIGTPGLAYSLEFTQESALLYNPELELQYEEGDVSLEIVDRAKENLEKLQQVDENYVLTLWFDISEEYAETINSLDVKLFTEEDTENRDIEGLFWIALDENADDEEGASDSSFCPNLEKIYRQDNKTSRLTFRHGAVFNINRNSRPPLKAGRYFIGVSVNQEFDLKEFDEEEYEEFINLTPQEQEAKFNSTITGQYKYFYIDIEEVDEVNWGKWIGLLVLLPLAIYLTVIFTLVGLELKTTSVILFPHITLRQTCSEVFRAWFIQGNDEPIRVFSYGWLMAIVISTFFISSFQFIWSQRELMRETGNRDICYYNDSCYRPSTVVDLPLNNVLSNFPYMLGGICFNIFVFLHEWLTHAKRGSTIFYALGWCLCGEGLFSALYHMCPQPAVYQFDTACMYAIAIIGALSVYQTHETHSHGDLHYYQSAKIILFFYVPLLIINYIGVWDKYAGVALVVILLVIWFLYVAYQTNRTLEGGLLKSPCICLAFVVGFALIFASPIGLVLSGAESVANAILYLLIAFMLIVLLTMTIRRSVWSHSTTGVKLILITLVSLGHGTFFAGLYYFKLKSTSDKAQQASLSRNQNKECFNEFMDWHDLWHVLSAFGLFFFALLFYYINTPHNKDELSGTTDINNGVKVEVRSKYLTNASNKKVVSV